MGTATTVEHKRTSSHTVIIITIIIILTQQLRIHSFILLTFPMDFSQAYCCSLMVFTNLLLLLNNLDYFHRSEMGIMNVECISY